ncbi:MAG: tRNA (adenosine(37)-N6)-dimethylallyltransferase MiaA [Rickettsiales bacterium]|jgi:tRNA dimethylallyltransferase|nr:tRNA (adenosine(37)-N6)-dimethylallyltransferase MiaA [Rickettsiales bacterium]
MDRKVVVICGPTASGKSSLAIDFSLENNGVIINCDSQQVYKDLRILTARPSVNDEKIVPHRLYGFLTGEENIEKFSVVDWVNIACNEIENVFASGKQPVLVGGTGFYISALINGISVVPSIDTDVRKKVRTMSNDEIYSQLKSVDSEIAAKLNIGDTQRIMRALEVFLSTGKTLNEWQKMPGQKNLSDCKFELIYQSPSKDELWKRIEMRIDAMLNDGVIDEVCAFLQLKYPCDLSICKSIGVQEISDYIDKKISYDEMRDLIIIRTRQYAKRQNTYFRNQTYLKSI